jgi:hypothetical protein
MRDEDLKVTALSFAFPAGLIDIEVRGSGKTLSCLFRHGLEFGAKPVDAIAHGSNAQIQTEQGVHDLHDPPSDNPVY